MNKKIAIVGGDLRIVKLAEMLAKDEFQIKTYALEKAESLKKKEGIKECTSIEEAIQEVEFVIGPIPLSTNQAQINAPFTEKNISIEEFAMQIKGKTLITGNSKSDFQKQFEKMQIKVIDLLQREELVVLNTISTAEGAIQIAMEETIRTLHGSNVLVLGFGRIGKVLANMLKGIGAKVYCEARNDADLAWVKAYGYRPIHLTELNHHLNKFDIIMNTIPTLILGEEELTYLKKDCFIIDLASSPGGVDRMAAEKQGIKTIWALALPGKVAPLTSAEFIKDTIYHVIKEK